MRRLLQNMVPNLFLVNCRTWFQTFSIPGYPHNPRHASKSFRTACSLNWLITLLSCLSGYDDVDVDDADDDVDGQDDDVDGGHKWRWCSGHSHTGELQVFDCINLASRVSFLSLILKKTEERNAHWAFFLSLFSSSIHPNPSWYINLHLGNSQMLLSGFPQQQMY